MHIIQMVIQKVVITFIYINNLTIFWIYYKSWKGFNSIFFSLYDGAQENTSDQKHDTRQIEIEGYKVSPTWCLSPACVDYRDAHGGAKCISVLLQKYFFD